VDGLEAEAADASASRALLAASARRVKRCNGALRGSSIAEDSRGRFVCGADAACCGLLPADAGFVGLLRVFGLAAISGPHAHVYCRALWYFHEHATFPLLVPQH